jgi:transcriptional regulator with XRE-family HTH domain
MAFAVEPSRNDQYRPPKQQAPAADKHVGRRIREWRMMLGVSQRTLAGQIGVTSQQLRKYERGTHRISAASLYRVARSLGVGVDCFFEGLAKGSELVPVPQQRLLRDLTRSFAGIADPKVQAALSELARALAAEPANEDQEPAAEE